MNTLNPTSRKNWLKSPMAIRLILLFAIVIFASNTSFAQDETAAGFAGFSDMTRLSILLGMLLFQIVLLYVVANIFKGLTANTALWKRRLSKAAPAVLLGMFLLNGPATFAASGDFAIDPGLETMLLVLNGIMLLIIVLLLLNVKKLITVLQAAEGQEVSTGDFLGLTDAVPLDREEEILTDHDYDGIHELDNNLPPWWILGFYITIFFAFVYYAYYEIYLDEPTGKREFAAEMLAADKAKAALAESGDVIDESNVTLLTDQASLDGGKEVYTANCVACHGNNGEGGVGPNFTDEYWIHGGGIKNLFKTITHGVPEKGMISWESMLSPVKRQEVASYILTAFPGTNPANAKEPQGELWKEETTTETSSNTEQADTTAAAEPAAE